MTDDIVTRLRGKEHGDNDRRCDSCNEFCCHCELCDCCLEILEVCLVAADEIERLRGLLDYKQKQLDGIRNAVINEGINPAYHRLMITRLKRDWAVLWRAINEAMKEPAPRKGTR